MNISSCTFTIFELSMLSTDILVKTRRKFNLICIVFKKSIKIENIALSKITTTFRRFLDNFEISF